MSRYYEISEAADTLQLVDGRAIASFTVRYVGQRPVEARARVVPVNDGTAAAWLEVQDAAERPLRPGQTETFRVQVTVPAGTATGRYGFRLDVMSVHNTDEEYDRGPTVAFAVAVSAPLPPPVKGFPWWVVIVTAAVLVIGIGLWIGLRNTDEEPVVTVTEQPEPPPREVDRETRPEPEVQPTPALQFSLKLGTSNPPRQATIGQAVTLPFSYTSNITNGFLTFRPLANGKPIPSVTSNDTTSISRNGNGNYVFTLVQKQKVEQIEVVATVDGKVISQQLLPFPFEFQVSKSASDNNLDRRFLYELPPEQVKKFSEDLHESVRIDRLEGVTFPPREGFTHPPPGERRQQ